MLFGVRLSFPELKNNIFTLWFSFLGSDLKGFVEISTVEYSQKKVKKWIFSILWFRLYMLVRGRKWVSNHKKRVLGTLQGVFEVQNSLSRNFPKILKKSTFCLKLARNPLKKLFLACLTLDFPWEWLEVGCQLMGSPNCLAKLSKDALGSWLQQIKAQTLYE